MLTPPSPRAQGCGRGYDVAMLALHGYDAYGLEVCDRAVQAAREYAAGELAAPSERNFSDGGQQERYVKGGRGIGRAEFVVGDFFSTDWEEAACSREGGRAFDLIYDYTVSRGQPRVNAPTPSGILRADRMFPLFPPVNRQFFCALLPSMRRDWARRMSELLAPSGVLVCLEFPLYKGLQHPGPPWGLREGIYWDVLAAGGDGLIRDEEAARAATRVADGGAFERIAYLKPARSYEIAKGTDMVSVWRLRGQKNRA